MTAIHLAVYNKQKRGQAKMEIKEILKHVDHTLLLQPSTWEEIKQNIWEKRWQYVQLLVFQTEI